MKRIFLFLLLVQLLVPSFLMAEDVLTRVPRNSSFIITFNGDVINKKMSFEDISKLPVFRDLLQKTLASGDSSKQIALSDLGINLTGRSAFFALASDSMMFFDFVFPIGNSTAFQSFVNSQGSEIVKDDFGNSYLVKEKAVLAWNNTYAVWSWGELSDAYKKQSSFYSTPYAVDSAAVTTDEYTEYNPVIIETDTTKDDPYEYKDPYQSYLDSQKEAALRFLKRHYLTVLAMPLQSSAYSDARFMKHQDNSSEAIFWVGTHKEVILNSLKNLLAGYYYQFEIPVDSPVFSEENYTVSKLTFNKSDVRIDTEGHMDPRIVKHYKRISKASVNKRFFKYVKGDNLFGYMGSAVNTQAFLEESPQMWKYYLQMFPYTHDISDELIDLMFLFVDKKAIGKLFKGDFLVAFTGLSRKEVEYSSYEYDSLFVLQEVKKTKMQNSPEFIFMYTTKDMESTNKFFSILYKKKLLEKKDGYFVTNLFNQSPFNLYFVIRKNVVFMCNSDEQLQIILNGGTNNRLSAAHKKMIRKNAFSMFVDIQNILTNLKDPNDKVTDPMLAMGISNSRQIYAYGEKVKGGTVKSEVKFTTPETEANSLKFLLELLNTIDTSFKETKADTVIDGAEAPASEE